MNRIDLICLGVRGMAKASAFYKNIGFQTHEKESGPAIIFFNNQGTKLELYPFDDLARDISTDSPVAFGTGGFGGIKPAIGMKSEQEADGFMEAVIKHGGTIAKNRKRYFGEAAADISEPRTAAIGKPPMARTGNLMRTICW